MGPQQTAAPQPQAPAKSKRGEFLALRLVAAVVLTVVLTLTAAGAISSFIELLATGQASVMSYMIAGLMQEMSIVSATMLIVLAFVPWFLFRSVKASLANEPKFTSRTVYKVAIYGGLALLVAATAANLICALATVISSLLSIGVKSADIGGMYLHKFLPSLLGAVVTGFIGWCMLQTARGRDKVNIMSVTLAIVSVVFGVALLIASAVSLHKTPAANSMNPTMPSNSLDSSKDTCDYYSSSSSCKSDDDDDYSF